MGEYLLDYTLIARLVFALLPHEPPYRLVMARTNWKFGSLDINILVLTIVYKGVAFPVIFTMMPKFGNTSTTERIGLMQRYIDLFGAHTIDCLLADREFVGDLWLGFLNPKQHPLPYPHQGKLLGHYPKKWSPSKSIVVVQ